MNLNSVNLVQVDGGTRVKQNDTSSVFAYKLVDENNTPIEALRGKSARITLATFDGIVYETSATVSDDVTVSFTISKILRPRDYMLEITCEGYVFPSDRSMSIEVVKTNAEYVSDASLQLAVSKNEVNTLISDMKSELTDRLDVVDKRTTALEDKPITQAYDDSEIRERVTRVEEQSKSFETREHAADTYQPKGNYVTVDSLAEYAKKTDIPQSTTSEPINTDVFETKEHALATYATVAQLQSAASYPTVMLDAVKSDLFRLQDFVGTGNDIQLVGSSVTDALLKIYNALKDKGIME